MLSFWAWGVQTKVTCVVLTVIAHSCNFRQEPFCCWLFVAIRQQLFCSYYPKRMSLSAKHGRISFSVLLFQDLAAILVILVTVSFMARFLMPILHLFDATAQ